MGKYLLLFLLGYYLFTDEFIDKILNHRVVILSLFFASQITLVIFYHEYSYYGDLLVNFVGWFGILSCLIVGKLFMDKENRVTRYCKHHNGIVGNYRFKM